MRRRGRRGLRRRARKGYGLARRRIGRRRYGGKRRRGIGRRGKRISFRRKVDAVISPHYEVKELSAQTLVVGPNYGTTYPSQKWWYHSALGEPGEFAQVSKAHPPQLAASYASYTNSDLQAIDSWKAYVRCSRMLKFMNRSNTAAYLTIYECIPRRDIPFGIFGSTGINNTQIMNLWTQGMVQSGEYDITNGNTLFSTINYTTENSTTGPVAFCNTLQFTPFDSNLFCRLFKITKVKKAHLGPGHSAYYKFGIGTRTWSDVDEQFYGHQGNTGGSLPNARFGKYKMVLISLHGDMVHYDKPPANANNDSGNPQTLTGSPVVDMLSESKWNFYYSMNGNGKPTKSYRTIYANNAVQTTYAGTNTTYDGMKQKMGYDANLNTGVPISTFAPWNANTIGQTVNYQIPVSGVVQTINAADVGAGQ